LFVVIRYEMRPEGTARAFWLRWHRSTKFKLGVLGFGLFPAFVVFTILSAAVPSDRVRGVVALVVVFLSPSMLSRALSSLAKRGERILSIDTAGITTETSGGEWHAGWTEVQEIVSTADFTFLLGRGLNSIAVPASAFADEDERQEFVRRANRYISAAASGTS
jgi:hypothetical protein